MLTCMVVANLVGANSVYDYLHYHSRTHEVLGIAKGSAKVRFGGERGRTIKLSAGDVAILPAGTGHQCIAASKTFLVVGAYPGVGTYDECIPTRAGRARNLTRLRKVARCPYFRDISYAACNRRDPGSGVTNENSGHFMRSRKSLGCVPFLPDHENAPRY